MEEAADPGACLAVSLAWQRRCAPADLHKRRVRVLLTGGNARVKAELRKAGIIELVGRENVFKAFSKAIATCRQLAETDAEMAKSRTVVLSESAESMPQTSQDPLARTTAHRTDGDR